MYSIFFRSVRRNMQNHPVIVLFLFLGIVTAIFCMNVTLAAARDYFEKTNGSHEMTTIAVSFPEGAEPGADLAAVFEEKYLADNETALFILRTPDDDFIIGWNGDDVSYFFPHGDGRIFTKEEIENHSRVAYLNYQKYNELANTANGRRIQIDDEEYAVVGCGWIAISNLLYPIDKDSPQTILSQEEDMQGFSPLVQIIPYTVFCEKYSPQLILLQFKFYEPEKLEEKVALLQQDFPDATVTMPRVNAELYYTGQKLWHSIAGLFLAAILWCSLSGMMQEWLKMNHKKYRVYLICGMAKGKILLQIFGEWLLLFILAAALATLAQWLLQPLLSLFHAGYMPDVLDAVLVPAAFYILSVLFSIKSIRRVLKPLREEGNP